MYANFAMRYFIANAIGRIKILQYFKRILSCLITNKYSSNIEILFKSFEKFPHQHRLVIEVLYHPRPIKI